MIRALEETGGVIAPGELEKRVRFIVAREPGGAAVMMFFNSPRDAGLELRLDARDAAALRAALGEPGLTTHLRDDSSDRQMAFGGLLP